MESLFLVTGSLLGASGVALGAFGAHALRSRVPKDQLEIFETGVRYQMYHALALLGTGLFPQRSTWLGVAGWLFLAGVIIFSGSLYVLVGSGNRRWGAVTPLGGLALIGGWVCLLLAALRL